MIRKNETIQTVKFFAHQIVCKIANPVFSVCPLHMPRAGSQFFDRILISTGMIRKYILTIIVFFNVFLPIKPVYPQAENVQLLGDFQDGWKNDWMPRSVGNKPTKYEVIAVEDSNLVLRGTSIEAASALWRMMKIRPGRKGNFSWRWKIEHSLSEDTRHKIKTGADYAARIFVVFQPHMVSWKTRALCYVWAANGEIGSMYRSPYAKSVGIIVVESGKEKKGEWISEERDPIADYKKIFHKQPEMITAVAIMVDTDNSNQNTVAWFDDLKIEVSTPQDDRVRLQPLFRPKY